MEDSCPLSTLRPRFSSPGPSPRLASLDPPWAIASSPLPVRGDSNQDGKIDISDAVYLLSCLFLGETCPDDPCGIDIDGDSLSNITDPIFLLDYLFRGGPEPPPCP